MHTVKKQLAIAIASIVALLAAGCNRLSTEEFSRTQGTQSQAPAKAQSGDERYDVKKMDFKPPKAVVTNDRHTGAFAQGAALSMDAYVKPLDPSPVKEVRLDTTHKII